MTELKLNKLSPIVSERFKPFADELLRGHEGNIESVHIIGSAVTDDYDPKKSDINSLVVLREMDLKYIEHIAPLGKKYGKTIAAPLIMTRQYILRSLDVFPVEFLDIKLIHQTLLGEDLFKDIEITRTDLRRQCEREIKVKLIGLRQGYISSLGDAKLLTESLTSGITGYLPLFRGIIFLMGKTPPISKNEVMNALSSSTGLDSSVFGKVLDMKRGGRKLSKKEIDDLFENYYEATEKMVKVIDELEV